MDNFQARVNQFFIDLSFHWKLLKNSEKEVLSGLAGAPGLPLAEIVSTIRHGSRGFETQFLPIGEAILKRHSDRLAIEAQSKHDNALEDLQKDYCVLYEINQRMEKCLDRFERKKAKRQAKQERVTRYFAMRNRKSLEFRNHYKSTPEKPVHIRLAEPLAAPRKRFIKGTPEYDEEKHKLDAEIDEYQKQNTATTESCDLCSDNATFICACEMKSCTAHLTNRVTAHGWVLMN
jgi:hypothetical protein